VSERLAGRVAGSIEALAARFWAEAGLGRTFPRNIERGAMLALPVSIVKLSALTVEVVRAWLEEHGIRVTVPEDVRDLMGCVVCHRGHVVLFVCGADPDDEVRITVAHELAHVILHYFLRRQAALAALGTHIAAVLDGDRPPTRAERTRASLAGMRLGPHAHLLPRGGAHNDRVENVEAEADDLALELVAPRAAVAARLSVLSSSMTPGERRAMLARDFGIPADWFHRAVPDDVPTRPVSFLGQVRSFTGKQT
jgi:Zn-dependent peptidase ImmA (M78 family)